MKEQTQLITFSNKNTVGHTAGEIKLLPSQSIPKCGLCKTKMYQYITLTTTKEMNLPFEVGSQLSIFCCPKHDEIPSEQYSDFDKVVQDTYQNEVHGHYSIVFNKPGQFELKGETSELLTNNLGIESVEDSIIKCEHRGLASELYESKIGGVPTWLNYSVDLNCKCGAPLIFLCQFKEHMEFARSDAKKPSDYNSLFNANYIYILACEKQCTPYSNIVVTDN